ncbi:MAG: tandem-95 repeat protein, partial [Pedosphaera sp.]|nr:tandem-95 repeat protein [Pedosphaera sp.]
DSSVSLGETFVFVTPAAIGAEGSTTNSCFLGMIDELAVYNRALATNEIQAIYAADGTGRCKEPPTIISHPVSQRVTIGSNVTFSVTAAGSPQLRYQWLRGGAIAGAANTSLSFIVQPASGGNYSVRVTNAFGAVLSSNAVLTVNNVPSALAQSVGLDEDTFADITLQGADLEGDPLTFSIVTPPVYGSLTGSGANRTYTPAPNFHGLDSFTFKVNDGLVDSAPATVSITVAPVNDPPVAQSQSVSLDEDTPTAIGLGVFDVDGDALTFTVGAPAHGSLTGIPPNLTYHPNTNFHGPDNFTFSVNDGQTSSPPATVSITVRPVNDAPFAKIAVSPLTEFAGVTNKIIIAPVCGDAAVVLDGSQSSDVENDPLQYLWLEGTNILSTAATFTNDFAPGPHTVTLVVSDGVDTGVATVTFDVLTPSESVGLLMDLVTEANVGRRNARPLLATLRAAAASFDRCDVIPGINQLRAFQNKLRAQVAPSNPDLAAQLETETQRIIDALTGP